MKGPHPKWWDWLFAIDIGLSRTTGAARVVTAVTIGATLLLPAAYLTDQPPGVAMVGAVVALVGAMQIEDDRCREVARTALLSGVSGAVAVAFGTIGAEQPWTAYVLFVAVMSTATWGRRFGARGRAVGTTAFVACLFTVFIGANPTDLPWLVGSILAGCSVSIAVCGWLIPGHADVRLRRTLRSLAARVRGLVGDSAPKDTLDDVILATRQLLDHKSSGSVFQDVDVARAHLLRLAVVAEHLAGPHAQAGRQAPDAMDPVRVRERLTEELDALNALVIEPGLLAVPAIGPCTSGTPTESLQEPLPVSTGDSRDGLAPETRAAVQVAVAGGLAVLLGVLVSPERWYWAVVGAFVVFANTTSRGATVRKAFERTVGTFVGVLAGLGVSTLLPGPTVALSVGLVVLFGGLWIAQASYALMVCAITIVLSLVYDVLGILTIDVLTIRLVETVVGAGVGTLVAMLFLPVRTGDQVRSAAAVELDAAADVVTALGAEEEGDRVEALMAAVDALDRAHEDLRVALAPLGGVTPHRRLRVLRRTALLVAAVRYWVRRLALAAVRDGGHGTGPHAAVAIAARRLAEDIRHGREPARMTLPRERGELASVAEALVALGGPAEAACPDEVEGSAGPAVHSEGPTAGRC